MSFVAVELQFMLNFLIVSVIALLLHEGAHLVAAWLLGVRVKKIGLNWYGPYLVRESGEPVSNAYISLAGPFMNLLLAVIFWRTALLFAQVNLVLGVSNLLPFRAADGWRAWQAIRPSKSS